jgi:23S rRNA U2552 (ribose-2'-O)-methylase RlmE/FtsJ
MSGISDIVLFVASKPERFEAHVKLRFGAYLHYAPAVRVGNDDESGTFQCRTRALSAADSMQIAGGRNPPAPPVSDAHVLVNARRADASDAAFGDDVFGLLRHIYMDDLMLRFMHRLVVVRDLPFLPLLPDLRDAILQAADNLLPGGRASVRLRFESTSRADDERISDLLRLEDFGLVLSPTKATHTLYLCSELAAVESVDRTAAPGAADRYRFGFAPADWRPLPHKVACESARHSQISSASQKISEALSRAGFDFAAASSKRFLDVGASPGGWTSECARHGAELVVAVDPSHMHPDVLQLPNVLNIRNVARKVLDEIVARGPFDVLMCDANVVFYEREETLSSDLAKLTHVALKPGALVIVTLKLPRRAKNSVAQRERIESIKQRMRADFDVDSQETVHLLANREHERTLIMRKRQSPQE